MAGYVSSGKDFTYNLDFVVKGELVSPEVAKYTLRDNVGEPIAGQEDVEIYLGDSNPTSIGFVIPGSANGKTKQTELRFIDIDFQYDGLPYHRNDYYEIHDPIRLPVSLNAVRFLVGADSDEITDEQIDLVSALRAVQTDVGSSFDISTIIGEGTSALPAVIEAIKLRAAMSLTVGLETGLMQMEQADNTVYRRFANMDFDGLASRLTAAYKQALVAITGAPSLAVPTFLIVATGTDPVTGA